MFDVTNEGMIVIASTTGMPTVSFTAANPARVVPELRRLFQSAYEMGLMEGAGLADGIHGHSPTLPTLDQCKVAAHFLARHYEHDLAQAAGKSEQQYARHRMNMFDTACRLYATGCGVLEVTDANGAVLGYKVPSANGAKAYDVTPDLSRCTCEAVQHCKHIHMVEAAVAAREALKKNGVIDDRVL